ncbi:hypothetical protein [Mucilaginibacter segetis]|uniref:DUF748 domain-containing protein n=1 Tax=Mucilaginibacter segetis TaxID=2793071 RepID=A0A934PR67_9SPHI|nr:hypothetical protein [Mucilaginibacter segetis]MBK0377952.1 hypothetical protein [Mucilaginibacter segetis]
MENKPVENKPIRKWPIILLAVLLVLSGGGYYFYKHYLAHDKWKPYVQAELKAIVLKATDSLYHIEYSDFDLDLASGDVELSDFKLVPDTNVYLKMVANQSAPDNLFILGVKKLTIKNLGARKAYQDKILNIHNITIDKPSLTIINKRYAFNDTVEVGRPKTLYQMVKGTFKQLRVDTISLKDVSLDYINKSNKVVKKTALNHLNINISDVFIDSLSAKDTSRFYYTKGIEVKIKDYEIKTPDSLYKARLKQIYFSTSQRKIVLDKVDYLPRYSKTDFYHKTKKPGDIFTLNFKQIAINNIDLQRFLRDQKLYANTMDIADADVEIYSNNAYKGVKTIKTGNDPHQALQKLSLDMKLNRINIKSTDITYLEADATSGYTGVISFKNTSGYLLNVTNDEAAKKADHYMTAHINTHFMNVAPLTVNFKFNLTAKNGAFNYNGTLGKFDGKILDKLVKPLALVHVESADIDKLNFNVDANNYYGKGHLEFYYHNLKIQLLKKEEGKKALQKQGFVSTLANTFIIDDDNPDDKGKLRPGPISLKRDPTWSFFSFLYKGLLDGLKPSVGYDEKTESKVKNTVKKVNKFFDKINIFKSDKDKKDDKKNKR